MKAATAACVLVLSAIATLPARAAGRLAEIEVIDRDSGQQLETFYHHGEYWVAGSPVAHYTIYLRNRLGERLLAVTSVDGINVVSGQSAGYDQAGYVLDPQESYQISGWRKSDYQVAAFAFATAAQSYAARTGRPDNIGVIGVALFRERPSLALQLPPIANAEPRAEQPSAPAAEGSPPLPDAPASATSESRASSADLAANAERAAARPGSPSLGTAHGEHEYSYVAHTQFVRRQGQPDEIVRIRYDSLEHLIALGVVRPQRCSALRPSPFPRSDAPTYVPDPPPY